MYDRAPRNIGFTNGQTPYHVGPGSYDINKKHGGIDAYAPFTSLAPRDELFANINEGPGPAQYNLRTVNPAVKGGSTLSNRELRFKPIHKDEIPGPGTYTVEDPEIKPHKTRSFSELRFTKPKIDYQRKKNPPSIQDPKYAFGFEENNVGELIPQDAPDRDPTLGPAYYGVIEAKNSYGYKGVHFGKYASKRTNFAAKQGPGPGEYDTVDPVHVDVLHYNIKMNDRRSELLIPRFTEVVIKNAERESIPGPGKYDPKRLFDNVPNKTVDELGAEYDRPPFGVQAKRFGSFKSVAPGPGAYNEPRTALTTLAKTKGLKNTPFLQSSTRFDGTYQSKSAPGPGQYKLLGFADESLRKILINGSCKPAFGQSSIRKFNLAKRDEYLTPGPAQYQIKQKPFRPRHENMTSNFASTSKRDTLLIEETPGPTAYNVPDAYDSLVKVKREKPRNKDAQKRQESFNVGSKRFFKLSSEEIVPGPGSYDVVLEPLKPKFAFAKQTDKRWKNTKSDLPGPADYELSTPFQDTILKGTFNATLNNPLLAKERNTKSLMFDDAPNLLEVS